MIYSSSILKWFTVFGLLFTATLSFAQQNPPTEPTEDIRPIRGAVSIPEPEPKPEISPIVKTVSAISGAILCAALLFIAVRRAKRRRIPNLQQKAISALEEAQSFMTEDLSRDYSISVSDIIRHFIEARFELPVTQRTTQEFLRELANNNTIDLAPYKKTLDHFLNQCDLGKFSGTTLTSSEMENLHASAIDVVQCEPSTNEATQKS